jgi:hypothetical protein
MNMIAVYSNVKFYFSFQLLFSLVINKNEAKSIYRFSLRMTESKYEYKVIHVFYGILFCADGKKRVLFSLERVKRR